MTAQADLPAAQQDDLQILLNNMRCAVLRLDTLGRVVYANASAEPLFGRSAAKLLGHTLAPPLLTDTITPLVSQALASRRFLRCRAVPVTPRSSTSGSSLVDIYLSPVESDGCFAGLVMECQDAQARLRFDRDAARAVQLDANRNMVRQLAHEIKNPIGGLRGAAQLLARRLPEEAREYTGVIMREADRLTQLVDTLLGPPKRSQLAWVNVHEPLNDLLRLTRAEVKGQVEVLSDYDPSLPPVLIDRAEVMQALHNIVRNALQAMDGRGRLVLRTRVVSQAVIHGEYRSNMVRVDVEDDGPGVPETLRDSLFFPLVTGRREGTGIGLSTALELISRQSGSIEFESQPGRTVFTVLLPAQESSA